MSFTPLIGDDSGHELPSINLHGYVAVHRTSWPLDGAWSACRKGLGLNNSASAVPNQHGNPLANSDALANRKPRILSCISSYNCASLNTHTKRTLGPDYGALQAHPRKACCSRVKGRCCRDKF